MRARPPFGPYAVMGGTVRDMFGNVGRNLEEGRIALYQAVARKA